MAMAKGCSTCGKLSSGSIFQNIGSYVNDVLTSIGQARAIVAPQVPTEGISSTTLSSMLPIVAIAGAIIYVVYRRKK